MLLLPKEFLSLMLLFAPLFSKRIWQTVLVLVVGAILAPGKRTVSAILRVMGLHEQPPDSELLPSAESGGLV